MIKRYTILTTVLLLAFANTVCLANDGSLRDASNATIGKIECDGTVRNAQNANIGSAKGVKMEWAAVFFFFNFFK
jgi:hypothetical protein